MKLKAISALAALSLQGCVVYPTTVEYFDEKCQIMTRRMELDATAVGSLNKCGNEACRGEILGEVVTVAASTVISGSIVVVGNVVYSLQRDKACKKARASAAPAPAASASAAAT
jgi:hypothetical protein